MEGYELAIPGWLESSGPGDSQTDQVVLLRPGPLFAEGRVGPLKELRRCVRDDLEVIFMSEIDKPFEACGIAGHEMLLAPGVGPVAPGLD